MTQRDILTQIKNPFLIQIRSSFQDQKKLYLALQYCPGGQLFGLLYKRKRLTESVTRFYAAQMIIAIQYLHSKNIIYRDLKPQNVLIGADGYIKLTDFGLSRNNIQGNFVAHSVCGTPEYLAPEVVNKQGHGKAVDWWCLGSIIYELINGMPPFFSKHHNQLYNKIRNEQPELNKNWSKNLRDLIPKLLAKDPQVRLKNASTIKQHPWINQTKWQDLIDKKLKPPFIPVIKQQLDVSNFSSEFTNMSPTSNADSLSQCSLYQGFQYQKSPMMIPTKLSIDQMNQQLNNFKLD